MPEPYAEWTQKNADLFGGGTNITEKKDALDGALTLEEIQAVPAVVCTHHPECRHEAFLAYPPGL